MHGCNLAAMDKPLKRSWMNLEHGRRLMTVEQRLTVNSGAAIWSCTRRWLFLVGHDDSRLQANPYLLVHKRGSRLEAESSNEI
jgi:hypothetical protein